MFLKLRQSIRWGGTPWPPFFVCFFALLLVGCRNNGSVPVVRLQLNAESQEMKLTEWQVAGPIASGESGEEAREAQSRARVLDHDFLKDYGFTETSIDESTFPKIKKGVFAFSSDFKNARVESADGIIRLDKFYPPIKNAVAYAACVIESPEQTEVVLVSGADDSAMAWLNGKQLFRLNAEPVRGMPYHGNLAKSANFSAVKLSKGKNFLLIKTTQIDRMWGFNCSLLTLEAARARAKANELYINDVTANSIVRRGERVELSKELSDLIAALKLPVQVEILNSQKQTIGSEQVDYRTSWSKSLEGLAEGVYVCKFTSPLYSLEEPFYYGDAESLLSNFPEKYASLKNLNDETKFAFEALLERRTVLLNPDNAKRSDKVWQAKIVYVITEFNDLMSHLSNGGAALDYPGTHLRGFRSKIDDQPQYYLVHVPASYAQKKTPVPMVVMVPYPLPSTSFLRSVLVANTRLIKDYTGLAEKYGYVVLFPFARGNAEASPISMSDILEAMDAVKADYRIDSERIYSLGWSYGGTYALLMGERYPGTFAAITAIMPPSDLVAFEEGAERIRSRYPPEWLKLNSPVELVESLRNTGIYIVHGDEDKTVPPEKSQQFAERCRALGFTCKLDIMKGMDHVYPPVDPNPMIFDFFKDKVLEHTPKTVSIATGQLKYGSAYWLRITRLLNPLDIGKITASVREDGTIDVTTEKIGSYEILLGRLGYPKGKTLTIRTNGRVGFSGTPASDAIPIDVDSPVSSSTHKNLSIEGPILHAFAGPFLLVEGTAGSKEEQAAVESLGQRFRESWKKDYWVECPIKKDRDLTPEDIKNKHLVLLGNAEPNSPLKQVLSSLPLRIDRDSVSIGDKRYSGNNLGLAVIYPNPLNTNKYLVVANANSIDGYQAIESNLSQKGWYDFAIWTLSNTKQPEPLATGYFDATWQKLATIVSAR